MKKHNEFFIRTTVWKPLSVCENDTQAKLIFVTSIAQYAAQGHEADALDFMVKPVSYPNFTFKMKQAMNAFRISRKKELLITQPSGLVRLGSDDAHIRQPEKDAQSGMNADGTPTGSPANPRATG